MEKNLTRDEKRIVILAKLTMGESAKDLAKEYNIGMSSILRWRREAYKAENRSETVEVVTKVDPTVLSEVVDGIKKKAEYSSTITNKDFKTLDGQLEVIKEGISVVQLLEKEFQDTMMTMLRWANTKITDDIKVSEWSALVTGISTLHNAAFGKAGGTTINMQQNNVGSSSEVSKFKSGFRS